MAFSEIIGQEQAVECLRQAVQKDRLAHAFLFLGPEGVGKTLTAKNFAKFLHCANPLIEGDRLVDCCDRCLSCRKVEDFNHPDVHWVQSKDLKKISIDDIRLVQRDISLKPYEGRCKVFIILEAQKMTAEAAHCLLKTLEEPPGFSLIILTAKDTSKLLPTIVSRCQMVKFYPLKLERLQEVLSTRYGLKTKEAIFLSAQAEGRIGEALSLKEADALGKRDRILERAGHPERLYAALDIFNIKDKRELVREMRFLLNWFRDILMFKVSVPPIYIINVDRMKIIETYAARLSLRQLEQIINQIEEASRLIESKVNPKIALEVMLEGIANAV